MALFVVGGSRKITLFNVGTLSKYSDSKKSFLLCVPAVALTIKCL